MEGWGCITFIAYVLLNDENTDIKERKLNSRTICHEISHMWFGNLVTMEWWNDIWLNEGFARYNEFKCLNVVKKELEIWDAYIDLIYNTALTLDSSTNTHPILLECKGPRYLQDIFDTIAYAKGASVLRMLDKQLGYQQFKSGIIDYLTKYSFKNTTTEDLFNVLTTKNSNQDVNELMKSWLTLSGFPVVFVNIKDKRYLELNQRPIQSVLNVEGDNNFSLWQIPLFIKTSKGVTNNFIMKEKSIVIDLETEFKFNEDDIENGKDFIKINHDISGFFGVIYQDNLLSQVLKIPRESLTNYDKIGLFFDYFIQKRYYDLFKILNGIKPIDSNIILKHALKLYALIKSTIFISAHLQQLFRHKTDFYKEDLCVLVKKVNHFFSSLVENESNQKHIEEEIMFKLFTFPNNYEGNFSQLNEIGRAHV